jgi:hypothetical protein
MDKINMVMDLSRNPEWTDGMGRLAGTRWGLAFKLAEYHDRWASISATDFWSYRDYVEKSDIRKGAKLRTYIESSQFETKKGDPNAKYDDIAREYLERIIELCSKNDIELMLINTGYNGNDEMILFADSIPEIAKENGLKYVDYTAMDLVDYSCDFQTNAENTHVNVSGAVKLTRHLGQYLIDNNLASDHRNEAGVDKWEMDYQKYQKYILQETKSVEYFEEYIEMLYGSEYDIVIDFKDDSILEERNTRSSLRNIGIDTDLISSGKEVKIDKSELIYDSEVGAKYLQNIEYDDIQDKAFDGRVKVTVIDSENDNVIDERLF